MLSFDDYDPALRFTGWAEPERPCGDPSLPFAVSGDFDGNGEADWAVLLRSGEIVKLLALHRAGATWDPHVVAERRYADLFQGGTTGISVCLAPVRAGEQRHNWETGAVITLPTDAFEEVFIEKAATLWQWDDSRYVGFTSRD